ncbi:EF-hand calcium-binding domain-containing protein 7 [Anguilla rostrata]|uniref:EF-hand calcium-binding domain-containing protein 7 n=1 Tax=Anguilla rostrata TaxID=7938 RepID=UPI0030D0F7AB
MQKSLSTEETFYINCRAAYLAVLRSSLANITSKEQLCLVLQQAGRNPSQKTLEKFWTERTTKLNFDDFCEILRKEKPTEESELLRAFRKLDLSGQGYVLHSELYKVLTSRGEKMSPEEVNQFLSLAGSNKDGKLDYTQLCRLLVSTAGRCQTLAVEKLESDAKLKQQNFGNQTEISLKDSASQAVPASPEAPQKTEPDSTPRKAEGRSSSRPSSARSRRTSASTNITVAASSTKSGHLSEPKSLQTWHHTSTKGCFFLEEDGGIVSLQYRLHLPQTSTVFLTIRPLNLNQEDERPSSWMKVDTALFLVTANKTKEDSNLVCFTEQRDKEKFGWKGELSAGTYHILPFSTGCRLRRSRAPALKTAQLVYRTDAGELALTKEFRAALSDIFEVIDLDGNGLLSLEEYNFFEERTSGEKCDEDAWAVCKENFDTKKNELTRQGFMELNLMEANDREGDTADLWVTLESMGYNRGLEMVEACPFVIDVYSEETQPTVQPINLESSSKVLNTALHRSVISKGEAKTIKGHENVIIHTYKSEARISSVIANKSNHKVTVHVNSEQSKNCISSRGMSVFAVEVPARTKMVCQHVLPINEKQEWTYHCVESIVS